MKKLIFLIISLFLLTSELSASHFMGGELWWECLSNGKYVFHARLYQECYGIDYQNTETMTSTAPGLGNIAMHLIVVNDITPICNNSNPYFPHVTCDGVTGNNQGGIKVWVYRSDTITMPATAPPSTGWLFSVNICNRNECTNIINCSQYCGYLRAIMYPYNSQPANICHDNTPVFAEPSAFVNSTGFPQSINHYAFDPDGDSLAYTWAQPWTDDNVPITGYTPSYSYTAPFPGPSINSGNIPAQLDPITGEITFTSFTAGAFVTCIKISSFRNGIHIADVFREEQIIVLSTPDSIPIFVQPPFPNNSLHPFIDTVSAGQHVHFEFYASDSGYLNDSIQLRSVTINAHGQFFGDGDTNASMGCPVPPCATLNMPVPSTNIFCNAVIFDWDVVYDHFLWGSFESPDKNEFLFSFDITDDYCPIPSRITKTVKIVVKPSYLPPPVLTNYFISSLDGKLTFFWIPIVDTLNVFRNYLVYGKTSLMANYQLLDSISDINQNFYSPAAPYISGQYFWYYLKTRAIAALSLASNVLTNYDVGETEVNQPKDKINISYTIEDHCLNLTGNMKKPLTLHLKVYDAQGKFYMEKELNLLAGQNQIRIPVYIKSQGVYLYNISGNNFNNSGKILIIK